MNGRSLGRVVILLIILAGVVIYAKTRKATDTGEEAKAQMMALLSEMENYDTHKKYLDLRADIAHSGAFTKALEFGRRRSVSFDDEVYVTEFFEQLINQVRDEGRQDLVKLLTALRDSNNIPRPSGG
jgi:hypothetical protein